MDSKHFINQTLSPLKSQKSFPPRWTSKSCDSACSHDSSPESSRGSTSLRMGMFVRRRVGLTLLLLHPHEMMRKIVIIIFFWCSPSLHYDCTLRAGRGRHCELQLDLTCWCPRDTWLWSETVKKTPDTRLTLWSSLVITGNKMQKKKRSVCVDVCEYDKKTTVFQVFGVYNVFWSNCDPNLFYTGEIRQRSTINNRCAFLILKAKRTTKEGLLLHFSWNPNVLTNCKLRGS